MNLDDKSPYYFEQISRRGFKEEKRKEGNFVYSTYEYFKTLTTKERRTMVLVAKDNKLMMRTVPGARFFVPERKKKRDFCRKIQCKVNSWP